MNNLINVSTRAFERTYQQAHELAYYHPALFMVCLLFMYHAIRWVFWDGPKKRFTPENCTNIVITGAAQGLGKQLAEQFVRRSQIGSINIIVVDIADHLAAQLIKDIKTVAGLATFKRVHFYKANLASVEDTERVWQRILEAHGPVHILVNNHARCIGKRFEDVSIDAFKLTMDINFHSYVHLAKLFLAQPGTKEEALASRFHLVNVNSIAGHMSC